ncbi:PAS domain-containing protein [Pelobacter propionicus]|uniref:histidine kinase n=1 Tax=Pelobacter propionicus (strain DSM 2379 / NBRC 103807 / OttBd1) TaxID=338966 RepID=A1AK84_PELPD|nr:PAS domain-containing protein [Pelobacter propionicus]ABK97754.1 multi-sensor signal transduction histidine kinase [Pelobacter propionicus DSM 2379]
MLRSISPKKSIRCRLLLLALGVELVMLTLLVANDLRLLHRAMIDQAHWQAQQMLPVLNAALKAPLARRDFASVQAMLDESRTARGIDYIVITDHVGAIMASSGWTAGHKIPQPSCSLPFFSFHQLKRYDDALPILQSGQKQGTLHLGLNLSPVTSARQNLLIEGIGIAVASLLLSALMFLLIGSWLTRHLSSLTRASLQVASGNLGPPPLSEGDDDIGHLGAAFNTMSRAISERVRELTYAKELAEASERAKSESEERLRLVLAGTEEAFWDWDLIHDRIDFSTRWAEMVGFTPEELEPYGDSWERLVHPDDLAAAMKILNEHLEGRTPSIEAEYRVRTKSGAWRWILDRGRVVQRASDGHPLRAAGTHTDITRKKIMEGLLGERTMMLEREIAERKQAQEMLAAQQAELEILNQSLQLRVDEAVAELRQKDQILISQGRQAAMGEMIGNIAHQWRQPLNALAMLISNLQYAQQDNQLTARYLNESATTANRLIQKMSTTINDFRNFFAPGKEMVSFSAMAQIRQAVDLVDAACRSSNIAITVDAENDCILRGFPNEYSQVLLNLLSNAREAIIGTGPRAGRIAITLREQEGMGVVTVRDNGGGIPEAILEKIFEPYFSTKSMGTGIGLYMSKMIIEGNMGGALTARSIDGGSEFSVFTPLAEKRS